MMSWNWRQKSDLNCIFHINKYFSTVTKPVVCFRHQGCDILKAHLSSKHPFELAAKVIKNCPLLKTKPLWENKTHLQEGDLLWLNHSSEEKKSLRGLCCFRVIYYLLKSYSNIETESIFHHRLVLQEFIHLSCLKNLLYLHENVNLVLPQLLENTMLLLLPF